MEQVGRMMVILQDGKVGIVGMNLARGLLECGIRI